MKIGAKVGKRKLMTVENIVAKFFERLADGDEQYELEEQKQQEFDEEQEVNDAEVIHVLNKRKVQIESEEEENVSQCAMSTRQKKRSSIYSNLGLRSRLKKD